MQSVTDADVRKRKEEVEDLVGRHEAVLAMLKRELSDLNVALQVMEGLHARPEYPTPPPLPNLIKKTESTKPEGTPTVPDMILEALAEAHEQGRIGLEPYELTNFVRERYWPDAPSSSVGPTAWRMAKDGRLGNAGGFYALAGWSKRLSQASSETKSAVTTTKAITAEDLF